MDNEIELENSQESHEELDLDLELESENQEEVSPAAQDDTEALKQRLADLEAKNKQLYARLKRQTDKPKLTNPEEKEAKPVSEDDWKKKMEFIVTKGRSLDTEELEEVMAYAKGKGLSYAEALESPVIKVFLSDRKSQKRLQNAIPSSTGRVPKVKGKTFEDMDADEKKANYSEVVRQLLESKR